MAALEITKLQSEVPRGVFDCRNASINALISESYYPTVLQHAYAFNISCEGVTIGYYMLKFLSIKLDVCPEEIADYASSMCSDCFSVHIKYIAIDFCYQKKGIGRNIMQYIIESVFALCKLWPIRLVTIEALKEKYAWYQNIGFVAFDEENLDDDSATIKMYIDCLLEQEVVNNM
ncbi:MAG: GNAT family N-acetyltransferase [Lachnospiraceae bacterium]